MSLELKAKEVRENYFVFSLGYGRAQYILNRNKKAGYTAGIYGWNSDIYIFNDVAISTGYRPFSNVTKKQDEEGHKIILKYDKKAEKTEKSFDAAKNNYNYNKLYKRIDALYLKMMHELKQLLINE